METQTRFLGDGLETEFLLPICMYYFTLNRLERRKALHRGPRTGTATRKQRQGPFGRQDSILRD